MKKYKHDIHIQAPPIQLAYAMSIDTYINAYTSIDANLIHTLEKHAHTRVCNIPLVQCMCTVCDSSVMLNLELISAVQGFLINKMYLCKKLNTCTSLSSLKP